VLRGTVWMIWPRWPRAAGRVQNCSDAEQSGGADD
jgi:hypothetical protein